MKSLYPNCIPVLGACKMAFYDLEKQLFRQFLKTDFFDTAALPNLTRFELHQVYENGWRQLEALQILMPENHNHIFTGILPSSFYKWITPAHITNAVID